MKKRRRCRWCADGDRNYIRYHDEEWGVPSWEDRRHFEFLTLESAQAGLNWALVLNKRAGYRKAFADFNPERVARFDEARIRRLLKDRSVIRNELKIRAAVGNAARFLEVASEFGSFADYLWGFIDGRQVQRRRDAPMPANTPLSDKISADLKRRGFKFTGSTIVYSHLQATGLVNDHDPGCFRRLACRRLAQPKRRT